MKKQGMYASYIGMLISISIGFHKMFVYANPESSYLESKNVYVGGDAYNYIINSNLSTAWFVLAGVFSIIGLSLMISERLEDINSVQVVKEETEVQKTNID